MVEQEKSTPKKGRSKQLKHRPRSCIDFTFTRSIRKIRRTRDRTLRRSFSCVGWSRIWLITFHVIRNCYSRYFKLVYHSFIKITRTPMLKCTLKCYEFNSWPNTDTYSSQNFKIMHMMVQRCARRYLRDRHRKHVTASHCVSKVQQNRMIMRLQLRLKRLEFENQELRHGLLELGMGREISVLGCWPYTDVMNGLAFYRSCCRLWMRCWFLGLVLGVVNKFYVICLVWIVSIMRSEQSSIDSELNFGSFKLKDTDFFFNFERDDDDESDLPTFLFLVVLTYGENNNNQHSKRIELDATNLMRYSRVVVTHYS